MIILILQTKLKLRDQLSSHLIGVSNLLMLNA